jgi:hypothetical protein
MISSIIFTIIFIISGTFFFINAKKIRRNILLGKDISINDNKIERLKTMLLVAFGQKKMFNRPIPAILHLFLYVAFVITQIELIEGYYNLDYKGYDIDDIQLKAGRLGLTAINDRYFSSHNGVKAITEIPTLRENDLFPVTPLSLKQKDIGKQFKFIRITKTINKAKSGQKKQDPQFY